MQNLIKPKNLYDLQIEINKKLVLGKHISWEKFHNNLTPVYMNRFDYINKVEAYKQELRDNYFYSVRKYPDPSYM